MAKILKKAQDIRTWAEARSGNPMLMDVPGRDGSLLQLSFGQHALNADHNEGPDRPGGYTLASWDDWIAELERQDLALKVNDEMPGMLDNDFEFVSRSGRGQTTEAAKKPIA